jgi:hypothetical protein
MMVIFAGRGELIVRFAFILLLSLSIFLSLVLYISGMRWGISILIVVTMLLCLHWPINDRIATSSHGVGRWEENSPCNNRCRCPRGHPSPRGDPVASPEVYAPQGLRRSRRTRTRRKPCSADDCAVCMPQRAATRGGGEAASGVRTLVSRLVHRCVAKNGIACDLPGVPVSGRRCGSAGGRRRADSVVSNYRLVRGVPSSGIAKVVSALLPLAPKRIDHFLELE